MTKSAHLMIKIRPTESNLNIYRLSGENCTRKCYDPLSAHIPNQRARPRPPLHPSEPHRSCGKTGADARRGGSSQRVDLQVSPSPGASPPKVPKRFSRAQRAHYRLSWQERLVRNARAPTAPAVTISLYGLPPAFATSLGLATV